MGHRLLERLRRCDLKAAAFEIAKGLEGGVYDARMSQALTVFSNIPCPETAIVLVESCPAILPFIEIADGAFARMTPKEFRGPKLQGYEERMRRVDRNLRLAVEVQSFLFRETAVGNVEIGVHGTRDQAPLFCRLRLAGIYKGLFADRRQFLRDTITTNPSAFRVVIDLICIHGIQGKRERFWDALGGHHDERFYFRAELMYEISGSIDAFAELLRRV